MPNVFYFAGREVDSLKINLFLLLDVLTTLIFSLYLYFTRGFDAAFFTGLSIFVAFSPICLILASLPVSRLARKAVEDEGITMNRPGAIEDLAEVDAVAMPLNRFLTDGEYFVTDLVPEGLNQSMLLGYAGAVEADAAHPLGKVIYSTALNRNLRMQTVSNAIEVPGVGVEGLINKMPIMLGNPDRVTDGGFAASAELRTRADQLSVHGKTVMFLGLGRTVRGIVALKDEIRAGTGDFVGMLRQKKITPILLTAAAKKMAGGIAKKFGIDLLRTNLTPDDKAREVQIFRSKQYVVAVIGNEFNDLPAMLNGDVSIWLTGRGSEEIFSGDVKPDFEIPMPEKFFVLRDLALSAVNLIKTNRRLAYLSWLVLVPPAMLTALENPPIFFHPFAAVTGVLIFSLAIMLNSMRMKRNSES